MIRRGVVPQAIGRGGGVLLLLLTLGATACSGATPAAAPVPSPGGERSRLTVGEQLVLLDAPQPPHAYDDVLTLLTEKCRESRIELAAALVVARLTLEQERGVT